jgi:formylmethanofuran dehydrogenase subunit E
MRIKKDKTNWDASNVLRKVTEPPERPSNHSRKNTKKWCKGKPGVEHDYQLYKTERFKWSPNNPERLFIHWRCGSCGKREFEAHERRDWRDLTLGADC